MTETELNKRIAEILTERPYVQSTNRWAIGMRRKRANGKALTAVVTRHYCPWIGYVKPVCNSDASKILKRPKSSKRKGYLKRSTSKRARREQWLPEKGNHYRKVYEYAWKLD